MYKNLEAFLNTRPNANSLESFNVEIFPSALIEQIPEFAGIYSWHFIPTRKGFDELIKCSSIYFNKIFDVEVSSDLKESYSGPIAFDKPSDKNLVYEKPIHSNNALFKYIQFIASNISPPIYIGRSENLNGRLKRHLFELQQLIPKPGYVDYDLDYGKVVDKDSDEESLLFAQRLAKIVNKISHDEYKIGPSNFFVRIMTIDEKITDRNKIIIEAEKFLLQLYKPIFSIK